MLQLAVCWSSLAGLPLTCSLLAVFTQPQPSHLPTWLCLQVGDAAAGRTVDSVGERCLHLMQRYQEHRRWKAAAAAAPAGG
jgi:hypothetical protein